MDTFVAGEGLDELFDEIESFRVSFGAHPDEAPLDLIAEIAPDADPEIPPSMPGDLSLNIPRDERQMQSYLWWPERLAVPAGSVPHARSRSLRLGDAVIHQAVRVDLSEPIHLSSLDAAAASASVVANSQGHQSEDPTDADLLEPLL